MKKLSWLLVLAMVLSMFAMTASAEGDYAQSPLFDEAVDAGTLPPVEERLPENPRIAKEILDEYLDQEIGEYGGTLRLVTSVVNWDADGFIGQNEALLTMESANSAIITPNIVEDFQISEDNTVFTFKLRKGLKWSDGTEVTMEDFRFGIEDYVFNEELTPSIAAYMRDGGVGSGDPFKFEVIDDETFTITFGSSYGGFAVHLSIAGWKGYTDLLKPAHYLKPFHLAYAEEIHGSVEAYYEFIQPYADAAGLGDATAEGVWVDVFNQIDCTNWELTDPNDQMTSYMFPDLTDKNFPVLYGWVMKSCVGGVTTWERNPYYFKVDADGNQLPYIDYITSTLVENMEMVQMKYMSGEADFGRESATIDNISLYRENEEKANITAYTTSMHNTPTDISLNVNYGLNVDGTVKDDDDSKAWQEVINLPGFRHALAIAIDAEELISTVYNGFGTPYELHGCTHDIEGAKAILDGLGMVDIDGDGYRETPSGLPFQFQIWNYAEANDIIPASELYVEFWSEIGIKAAVYTTESTMLDTSREANEIPCRVSWVHETQLWHYADWFEGNWAPLFEDWFAAGGLAGEEGAADLLAPPEEIQQFHKDVQALFTVDPETAVNELLPGLAEFMAEYQSLIIPITEVQQCVIINSDIGNVPEGGVGISWNFAFEQFYYEQ